LFRITAHELKPWIILPGYGYQLIADFDAHPVGWIQCRQQVARLAAQFQDACLGLYNEPQQSLNRIVIVSVLVNPLIALWRCAVLQYPARLASGLERCSAPSLKFNTRTGTRCVHCE